MLQYPPTLDELKEKFDVVFVLEGMEKVSNPVKAFLNVRSYCKNSGKIFMLLRTPLELGTKNRLDYYEDNWRYEQKDITNFFSRDKNFKFENLTPSEVFLVSFKKASNNFHEDQDFKFFNCRAVKKITYTESLKLNYFRDCQDLKNIAQNEPTDKVKHGYLEKYDFLLKKFRTEKFNLLELGIFNGGSLRMWKKYFPNAEIYGVDINPDCAKYAEERIHTRIMDLSLVENLESLKDIQPAIIIDDASHIWSHQIKSLIILFEILPSGGIFIMEDMETSLNTDLFPGFNDFQISIYDVCERIARVVASKRPDAFNDPLSAIITKIGMATELIATIKGSCIFIKR